ncbi:uncharacterized protein ASPGLDRAFT_192118 [Aspergillus glaucus CBS 516.65]|uniref:Uncharacterized protein n=1 Tax=Aspergillus glaucus CBS 516.65 TaxID=1160497 RepID=A0A1L9VYQ3_ASPGL|nr:hypothetical protein ASPGLDRAFT_192118 [Aspergillus glaucus CBS 516.65]OJJ89050.1 hypothetical protein ASPGLDRAFT_192118 [Aspergillus glaucus CBS 516.65]
MRGCFSRSTSSVHLMTRCLAALVSRNLAIWARRSYLSAWITSVVTIKLSSMFTHCIDTNRVPVECLDPDVSPVHSRGVITNHVLLKQRAQTRYRNIDDHLEERLELNGAVRCIAT